MKKFLVLAMATLLVACGNSFDPAKVKHGMTTAELIASVGEPDQKVLDNLNEVWKYGKAGVTFKVGQVDKCIADYQMYAEKCQALNDTLNALMGMMGTISEEEFNQRMQAVQVELEKLE